MEVNLFYLLLKLSITAAIKIQALFLSQLSDCVMCYLLSVPVTSSVCLDLPPVPWASAFSCDLCLIKFALLCLLAWFLYSCLLCDSE